MKDIIGLPDVLNTLVSTLTANAQAAVDRLNKAKDGHENAVAKVHRVADAVEQSTAKTEDIINQMMGGNQGP